MIIGLYILGFIVSMILHFVLVTKIWKYDFAVSDLLLGIIFSLFTWITICAQIFIILCFIIPEMTFLNKVLIKTNK